MKSGLWQNAFLKLALGEKKNTIINWFSIISSSGFTFRETKTFYLINSPFFHIKVYQKASNTILQYEAPSSFINI